MLEDTYVVHIVAAILAEPWAAPSDVLNFDQLSRSKNRSRHGA